jgi:chromosome segregation ATPase
VLLLFEYVFYLELAFRLTELLAKRPSIDEISAKLEVLESKHESLQQSLKESHERETKLKKELEENHTQEMTEMAEKLKNSNNRVKTLASKLKAAKAEAADVDKLIFRKDFTSLWHVYCILLFPTRNLIT